MIRLRLVLPALATAVLAAACGGSSNSSNASNNPPPQSTPPSTSTASAPADETAAKAEITKNWETFLASGTAPATAVTLLEKGEAMGPALKKARAEDKATGGKRSAKVVSIEFTSPTTANVNYKLHAAGQVLNSSGTAVLEDGVWKVTDVTFCTLVVLGNGGRPVKGCS